MQPRVMAAEDFPAYRNMPAWNRAVAVLKQRGVTLASSPNARTYYQAVLAVMAPPLPPLPPLLPPLPRIPK